MYPSTTTLKSAICEATSWAVKPGTAPTLSAVPELLTSKLIDQKLVNEMKAEWERAIKDPEAVLFYFAGLWR